MRGLGAHIKGTNGESQGVVPFLKVANDTAIAVNQGGKRKGAVCAYLETWHIDIEEFLELRKNTGDDRRRTHDMNTANWVPDLFMQRVEADGDWTLFSPDESPDLHDLYGEAFAERYADYEAEGRRAARSASFKQVRAVDLWRKMLTMLFETGHPWITFKDACNVRSPAAAMPASSTPRTSAPRSRSTPADDETAVCNLGSVNLPHHVTRRPARPRRGCSETVAHRDAHARQRHRHQLLPHPGGARLEPAPPPGRPRPDGLPGRAARAAASRYASEAAVAFADSSMEAISYYADLGLDRSGRRARPLSVVRRLAVGPRASCRSTRSTCWRRSAASRSTSTAASTLDWEPRARARSRRTACATRNVMAIAPTATISNISGVVASRSSRLQEPLRQDPTCPATSPSSTSTWCATSRRAGLWDEVMVNDLKYFDGSVQAIDAHPRRAQGALRRPPSRSTPPG